MPKLITKDQINKIYEAHKLKKSLRQSAEYANVSKKTVYRYWDKKGLEAHFEVGRPAIAQEKISKIYEAHELRMSTRKASKYAGVSQWTVINYWNKKGLEKHF